MPAGLFSGNLVDYGHYDQCVTLEHTSSIPEVKKIKSQHCLLPVQDITSTTLNTSFVMGICAPRSCRYEIVYVIMNTFLKENIKYGVSSKYISCKDGTKPEMGTMEWVTTSFFIVLGVLIVICTIYDYVKRWKEGKLFAYL